jgi:aminoglycoside 2'-N-acetyltransferase I
LCDLHSKYRDRWRRGSARDSLVVPDVIIAHTAQLDAVTLKSIRTLVERAFEGDFDEHDWDHALGGVHALIREGSDVVAHACVVLRRMIHGGRTLRVGYVEAVAVRADRRRAGYGRAVVAALEPFVRGGFDVGALAARAMADGLYVSLGWEPWRGRTFALTPHGVVRTEEEDDAIHVLIGDHAVDRDGDLTCDWRAGDLW